MNRKIKRYLEEIDKTERKLEELNSYLKGIRAALRAEEETEMIKTIRGMKLEGRELFEFLNNIQSGKVVFQPNEESESDEEEGSFSFVEADQSEMGDDEHDEMENYQ